MTIRYIKTTTLTSPCVLPCPLPAAPMSVYIPISNSIIKSGANLKLSGGCSDCNVAIDIFAKLQPFILSLGIPLCVVRCALAMLTTITDAADFAVGSMQLVTGLASVPPEVPTPEKVKEVNDKLLKITTGYPENYPNQGDPAVPGDIPVIAQDCACIYTLFTPVGLCLFLKSLRDILNLIAALLNCFATLMGDILKISLRAKLFSASSFANVKSQGVCLGKIARNQLNQLNVQLDLVWLLIEGATVLFEFVEKACEKFAPGMYPDQAKVGNIKAMIAPFRTASAGELGVDIETVIPSCTTLKNLALDMRTYLKDTADIINAVVQVTCP